MSLKKNIAEGKLNPKLRRFLYSSLIIVCVILLGAVIFQNNLTLNMRIIIFLVIIVFAAFSMGVIEFYVRYLQKIAKRSMSS